MADEMTELAEATDVADETSLVGSDEALINAAEPVASGSTLALNRKAQGGLSFQFTFDIPAGPKMRAFPKWTHRQLFDAALVGVVALLAAYVMYDTFLVSTPEPVTITVTEEFVAPVTNVRANVETSFNRTVSEPMLAEGAYVDAEALVIGSVVLGANAFVGPGASIRADEGTPIFIGAQTNVQDGAVIHALLTSRRGKIIEDHMVVVDGQMFAVHVGKDVSISHGAQIHGPVMIGDETHVGLNAIVFDSKVGHGVVIEPGAIVMGVTIADLMVVPAGAVITTQAEANALTGIPEDYHYGDLIEREVEVNEGLAEGYRKVLEMTEASHGEAVSMEPAAGHE